MTTPNSPSPPVVWHYAPLTYLPRIRQTGALRASNAEAPGELAMLWFSAHQGWEPTATKLVIDGDGTVKSLTFEQQVKLLGCIRFGLAATDLRILPWAAACQAAGTPNDIRFALEQSGLARGANPAHWFGCKTAIALSELSLEVWDNGWPAMLSKSTKNQQQRQAK